MSTEEAGGTDPEEAGEPGGMSERTAKAVLVLLGAVWGIVAVWPEIAYVIVGIIGTCVWQKTRGWIRDRRDPDEGAAVEREQPDVGAALRRLIGDDKGVLLTRLRDDLKLSDTKVVKALLEEAGIPWKASRTREGNGPAVRKEAIPAAPSPSPADPHGVGCCCRSGDNDNGNNGGGEEGGKGVRVQRTNGGLIIYDLSDEHRHQPVK
ncbi:hypothetical protein G9272_32150 [Streptomyces asoensis]|uniref:Uncharacterized protein n=1 Tax=Streptomyces asoensis TaxID=249586 RepID=A0A6M4WXM6_9ACTN|nr:hypothetical protein [Streptomyces asoensis]QJT04371.1 hypothetical protein G9272_32150 [Streptomyces asoensis]